MVSLACTGQALDATPAIMGTKGTALLQGNSLFSPAISSIVASPPRRIDFAGHFVRATGHEARVATIARYRGVDRHKRPQARFRDSLNASLHV